MKNMKNYLLITNNDQVEQFYKEQLDVVFLKDGTYEDVLLKVRQYIHQGHKLISHPMSGSIKPNETPYKSVVMEKEKSEMKECFDSTIIIENCLESFQKFQTIRHTPNWPDDIREDFKLIDLSFMKNAIKSA